MGKKVGISVILLLLVFSIFANEPIRYNLTSSSKVVDVNKIFQVTLEVLNQRSISVIAPSNTPNVSITQAGKSTSYSIVNGRHESSIQFSYIVRISKEGGYDIGPFQIRTSKTMTETSTIHIDVVKPQRGTGSDTTSNAQQTDNCFLKMVIDKKSVYAGEAIDISVRLYSRAEIKVLNYKQLSLPANAWIEDIKPESDYRGKVQIGNLHYDEYEIEKKRVFISVAGSYTIPEIEMNLYVFLRTSIFGYNSTPTNISTEPVNIQVSSLPENPKINSKTGIPVGDFDLSVDFSTQEAMEGSSITLSTTLTGTGKFHGIKSIPISYADNTFEIFSSKSNIIEKEKIPVGKKWETLLIPKKPGKLDITIDEFIYFDSELREYKNIPAQTYSFTISKDPNKKAQVTYSDSNEYKTENSTVKKEIFISNILGKKSNISTNKSFLKIMIIMYAVFFIVTLLILIFFHYVLPFMKQVTQKPEQMLLSQIDTVLKDNKSSAMIRLQKLYNSFEKYLSSSFDIDSLQIQKNKIAQAIGEKLPPEELDKLKSIIGDFDFFRFGATDVNDETIVGLARDVKALTRNISKVQMERVK